MPDFATWFDGLAALAVFAFAGWLLSLPLRNVSIVDSLWSLMFLLAGLTYAAQQDHPGPRAWLVIVLVGVWSLRLAAYITWRNRGHGEDFRYRKIRANNEPGFAFKSLYIVFGLQAALAWVISLPLLAAIGSTSPLGWLDGAGTLPSGNFASTAFALNGLYSFNLFGREEVRTYVGLGLAYLTEVDIDFEQGNQESSYSGDGLGLQVLAGARYEFGQRWFLDAGLRYLNAGKVSMVGEGSASGRASADYNPWSATLGIGWRF